MNIFQVATRVINAVNDPSAENIARVGYQVAAIVVEGVFNTVLPGSGFIVGMVLNTIEDPIVNYFFDE